jgi:hypothetical protein
MRAKATPRKPRRIKKPFTVETKWGWMPCVEEGWCVVPSSLLRHAAALGLSPEEGWLLIQLLDLKWSAGGSTLQQLTDRCNRSPEEIGQLLTSLQSRGFMKVISKPIKSGNGASHEGSGVAGWEIDLSPLLRILNDLIMRGGDLSAGFLRLAPNPERPNGL